MTLPDADIEPDPVLGEDTGDYRLHCGRTIQDLAVTVERLASYPITLSNQV